MEDAKDATLAKEQDARRPMTGVMKRKLHQLNRLLLKDHACPSIVRMHKLSSQCQVPYKDWSVTLFARSEREDVVRWLLPGCASFGFHDRWATAALVLLDRFAHTKLACSWMCAETLWYSMAALLIAMKMREAEAASGLSYKKMLTKLVGKTTRVNWWDKVREAECVLLVALGGRVYTPTAMDLVEPFACRVCPALTTSAAWHGLERVVYKAAHVDMDFPLPRFAFLAMYIVELGMVHAASEIYRSGVPPATLALAGVELAILAYGDPPARHKMELQLLREEVEISSQPVEPMPNLRELLVKLWLEPPVDSAVACKWRRRERELGEPFPAPPAWLLHGRSPAPSEHPWSGPAGGMLSDEEPPQTPTRPMAARRSQHCEATQLKQHPPPVTASSTYSAGKPLRAFDSWRKAVDLWLEQADKELVASEASEEEGGDQDEVNSWQPEARAKRRCLDHALAAD